MPIGPRLDSPGTLHHVIIRGDEKREIVADDKDRDIFVSSIQNGVGCLENGTKIYAWALITNHAQILLKSGQPLLSVFMRLFLAVSYSETAPLFGMSASAVYQIIKIDVVACK
jgi:putative transposase